MGRTSNAREKLLQVAFEQIWGQSYGSVSVDQICQQADVRKGSLYHFFPSKSQLASAALEDHWQTSVPRYNQIFSAHVPPLERIRNYCQMIIDLQTEAYRQTGRVPGCPYSSAGSELSNQEECVRQTTASVFDRVSGYLEQALRDAAQEGSIPQQDFAATAHSITAYIVGMVLQAKVKNNVKVMSPMPSMIMRFVDSKHLQ